MRLTPLSPSKPLHKPIEIGEKISKVVCKTGLICFGVFHVTEGKLDWGHGKRETTRGERALRLARLISTPDRPHFTSNLH